MRKTFQAITILDEINKLGHATNAQLWLKVQEHIPSVTLPSIHRTTAKMIQEGEIGGTLTLGGQVILDANTTTHSHFTCSECKQIKDLQFGQDLINTIQEQIGGHILQNNLVVHGTCLKCSAKKH